MRGTPIADIPEHMREEAEHYRDDDWTGFFGEYYEESECECGRRIYKYAMDIIVEWKHVDNYSCYCVIKRASPKND